MLKRFLCLFLAIFMLSGLVACSPDEQIEEPEIPKEEVEVTLMLVQDNASLYTIIYPENATASEEKAVAELQSYIKQISGAELPIKTDAEPVGAHEILVGYTNRATEGQFDKDKLGDEGFVIEIADDKLFIAGSGVRGALYGVYSFLEEYLGCRFYTADFEKIPESG